MARRIEYLKGDIFDSNAQVIVNTVNCKGVMGKGLALAFKQRYPAMFKVYQAECQVGKIRIGRPSLYKASNPWILNFPTKNDWRFPSKLEYLEKGLDYFVANYKKAGIKSIAFPKLGAQNGKLSWDEVGPLMVKYLSQLDIDVYIYIADGDAEFQYDEDAEKSFWKRFSKLACSAEGLHQEIQINQKDAKKIAMVRKTKEFTSQTDIDSIEGLAQTARQKIRNYIQQQEYLATELPGMESEKYTSQLEKQKRTTPSKRRQRSKVPQQSPQKEHPMEELLAASPVERAS